MVNQDIEQRARELWNDNPGWGKRRMASELRLEFGKALRDSTLLEIKNQVAYADPSRAGDFYQTGGVSMKNIDVYRGWRQAGFTPFEARELVYGHGGVNVNSQAVFDSEAGRKAREERTKYIEDLKSRGWSKRKITEELKAYYKRSSKRSPWDFIRAEYNPNLVKKKDSQDDSQYNRMVAKRRKEKQESSRRVARGRR